MKHLLRNSLLAAGILACLPIAVLASPNDTLVGDPDAWTPYGGEVMFSYAGLNGSAERDSCDCLDLVLVIDDTGSMSGAIANVQAGMLDIIRLAEDTCNDVAAGLVTFKDEVEVDVALTSDLSLVTAAVNSLFAVGGDNEPEASDEALREVFTSTVCTLIGDFDPDAWREGCCKVTILVTDARPGGCDDDYTDGVDDVNAHARALEAAGLDIAIGAVFVPTFGDPTGDITPIMVDYAATTGGVFGQTAADGGGTANAIEQIILNCVGEAATELCCTPAGDCVEVLEGNCETLGGYVVSDCEECETTPVEPSTWGRIKSVFGQK